MKKDNTPPATICPTCGAEVIPGSEICEACGMDLYDTNSEGDQGCKLHQTMGHDLRSLDPPEPVIASPDETVTQVIEKMIERGHGAVCVVENDELVGIFTERDVLMRVAAKDVDIDNTLISEVMTKDPLTLKSTATVAVALNQMSVGGLRHIPVLDGKKPVAITSVRGVLAYLAEALAS